MAFSLGFYYNLSFVVPIALKISDFSVFSHNLTFAQKMAIYVCFSGYVSGKKQRQSLHCVPRKDNLKVTVKVSLKISRKSEIVSLSEI